MTREINKLVRSYCQGKFHRIFLLLSLIGTVEVISILIIFHLFVPNVDLVPTYLILLGIVYFLSAFVAKEGKHLFR